MEENLNPLLLGLICDCNKEENRLALNDVVVRLCERTLQFGDRASYYREGQTEVYYSPIQVISRLSLPPKEIRLGKAINETVELLVKEVLDDYRKYVVVVSDRLGDGYGCRRAITLSNLKDLGVGFLFFDLGDGSFEQYVKNCKNVVYESVETTGLTAVLDYIKNLHTEE